MINYNRLGYELKRDLSKFSEKISKGLKRPKSKFVLQMIYGILAGNKVHLSEISRSLHEDIKLKKTIERLSRNLFRFDANDYYRYFLKNEEKFVIRAKKNRSVIYYGKTQNIMDVANKYKGSYRMDFIDKKGRNK